MGNEEFEVIWESLGNYYETWIKETARIKQMLKLIHTENKIILYQMANTSKRAREVSDQLGKAWDELEEWNPEIKKNDEMGSEHWDF